MFSQNGIVSVGGSMQAASPSCARAARARRAKQAAANAILAHNVVSSQFQFQSKLKNRKGDVRVFSFGFGGWVAVEGFPRFLEASRDTSPRLFAMQAQKPDEGVTTTVKLVGGESALLIPRMKYKDPLSGVKTEWWAEAKPSFS